MNRRHLAAALVAAALIPAALSQQGPASNAVAWTTEAVALPSQKGQRVVQLKFSGRITEGYIVYGSDFKAELGPNPTRVRFTTPGVTAREALRSQGTHAGKDKAFNVPYTYFEKQAELAQDVVVPEGTTRVAGTLRGQTCYEADGTCTLFSVPFDVAVP